MNARRGTLTRNTSYEVSTLFAEFSGAQLSYIVHADFAHPRPKSVHASFLLSSRDPSQLKYILYLVDMMLQVLKAQEGF